MPSHPKVLQWMILKKICRCILENILLLDPQAVEGEYERHTRLKIIRGEKRY